MGNISTYDKLDGNGCQQEHQGVVHTQPAQLSMGMAKPARAVHTNNNKDTVNPNTKTTGSKKWVP